MFAYKAVVAYDGRGFHGMAAQDGFRTVAADLIEAIDSVFKRHEGFSYAGRTDAGVHALGQVIRFDLDYDLRCRDVQRAINGHLAQDLRLLKVSKCDPAFNPRHDAKYKTYRYVLNTATHDPMSAFTAYQYGRNLDVVAMRLAAKALIGTHDFLSYSTDTRTMTTRTLFKITITRSADKIVFTYKGRSFLRYMVRMMTGALVAVGSGRASKEDLQKWLENPKKGSAKTNAPSVGLTLVQVVY